MTIGSQLYISLHMLIHAVLQNMSKIHDVSVNSVQNKHEKISCSLYTYFKSELKIKKCFRKHQSKSKKYLHTMMVICINTGNITEFKV